MVTTGPAAPIACGIDGSAESDVALDWAIDAARRRGLPLHLVHARGVPFGDPRLLHAYMDEHPHETEVMTNALARVAEEAPEVRVTSEEPRTTASRALLRDSDWADSIVVGAFGHGATSALLLGSTSVQVSTHSTCPTVVVRGNPDPRADVVIGVDGSTGAEQAIRFGLREASERGVGVTAVHASWLAVTDGTDSSDFAKRWQDVRDEERERAFDAVQAAMKDVPDVTVRQVVVTERPVEALVDASRGASLVVVGSRGRGGFTGLLLGSVGRGVLHGSVAPVAIVRPH